MGFLNFKPKPAAALMRLPSGCFTVDRSGKVVGVLRFNSVRSQRLVREIAQIERHNHVGLRTNCGGENVPIIGIGKRQRRDERFVVRHQAIAHVRVHQVPNSFNLFP